MISVVIVGVDVIVVVNSVVAVVSDPVISSYKYGLLCVQVFSGPRFFRSL